jgi:hypothetical protein
MYALTFITLAAIAGNLICMYKCKRLEVEKALLEIRCLFFRIK